MRNAYWIVVFISLFGYDVHAQCSFNSCADTLCGELFVEFEQTGSLVFCEGGEVKFKNVGTSEFDTIFVDWNDGAIDTLENYTLLSHKYTLSDSLACATSSNYVFTVCILGVKRCQEGQSCQRVSDDYQLSLLPRAIWDYSNNVCLGDVINFQNESCHINDESLIIWDFGDNTGSTEDSPSHIYGQPGTYSVTLTVTNDCGTDSKTMSVEVVDFPVSSIDLNGTGSGEGCAPFTQLISSNSNQWVDNLEWTILPDSNGGNWFLTDTNATLGDEEFEVQFNTPGTYTLTLEYSNACATEEVEETIIVNAPIEFNMNTPEAGCDMKEVCFSELGLTYSGTIDEFKWTFVNGTPPSYSSQTDPNFGCIVYAQTGTMTLEIIGPCGTIMQVVDVVVIPDEEITIDANLPPVICQNADPIYLDPSVTGGNYYINGVLVSFIEGDTLFPQNANPQTSTIKYIVGEGTPCPVDTTFDIVIVEGVTVSLQNEGPFCDMVSLSPAISSTGGISDYSWVVAGDTTMSSSVSNPTFDLLPGTFTVVVQVTGDCGVASDTIDVVVQMSEQAVITPVDDPYCMSLGPITLQASPSGGMWSGPGIVDPASGVFDPTLAGAGSVTIMYAISNGACSSQTSLTFEIIDSEITTPPPLALCSSNETYTFSGFGPAGGSWSGPGVVDSIAGTVDLGQLNPGETFNYMYCVDAAQVECEPCATTSLTIEPLPEANFDFSGEPCLNTPFQFLNNSNGAGTYLWNFGDGNSSMLQSPTYTYTQAGDFDVTLIVESAAGCKDTVVFPIHVVAPPTIDVTFGNNEGCAPFEVEYVNQSTGEGITQYWIIDFTDTLFEAQPTIILDGITTDSIFTIEFVVMNGCAKLRDEIEILVHPYPIVDFGINDDEGCSPDTVWFASAVLGLPETILWDFGNGNTYSGINPPSQVYSSPDDSISMYTIRVEARNACGADTLEKNIIVYPNNVDAFFEIDSTMGCPPLAVSLTNYATPGSTITYDFGDGGTGNTGDTTYVYTKPGTYVITQYAQLCGIDSIKSDSITVFPTPDVAFSHDLRACVGEDVIFDNLSSAGLVAEWDFGDGQTSGEFAPSHIYDTSGIYTVTLTMYSDFFNCPAIETSQIEIPDEPIADFTADATAACPDEPIVFTNSSTGAVHFEWDFGDMSGDTTQSPVHSYTDPGEYNVTLIVFDAIGCSSVEHIIQVTIFDKPTTEFDLSQLELCFGVDSIFTENNSVGYTSSIWYLNGAVIEEQKDNISIGDIDPGDYELRLVSTNAFGCTDEMSRLFTVYPQPLAEFELSDRALCEGDTSGILNLSTDATDYYWTVDDVLLDLEDGNLIIPESGEYEVKLIAENSGVCRDTFTYPFLIKVYDGPIAGFSYIVNQDPNILGDVEFINLSIDADSYLWDFGDGLSTDEYSPSHEYDINGPVSVCLTATNFNNGEFTCVDKAFELIEFERINRFYAPNGMSPDKNFGNDLVAVFKPVGIGVEAYELNMYSPWGDKVATLNQVVNEAPADFWDGTYRGEVVPQGTYLWKARIEYTDGDVEIKVGNLTVVR